MNKKFLFDASHFLAATSALALAILMLSVGCDMEVASSTERIYITPDSTILAIGGQQEFVASGGYEYTWSLENESWGTLSSRTGDRTIYTSLYDPGTDNQVQTLAVVSTIAGTTGTNSSYIQGAEAYITHVSAEKNIFVSPGSASLKKGEWVILTASGGSTYTWQVSNTGWGGFSDLTVNTVKYTSTKSPTEVDGVDAFDQIITVTEDIPGGSSATAIVTHQ